MTVKPASEIWRDYETDGVPASGAHKPVKADIREWGVFIGASLLLRREVTEAGDIDALPSDGIIEVNKEDDEATNVNTGLAADRNGAPLIIKDTKGDAETFNITPVLSGGELIDGLPGSAFAIVTNRGSLKLYPNAAGNGWYTL